MEDLIVFPIMKEVFRDLVPRSWMDSW